MGIPMSGQLCPKKNCFVLSLKCAPLKNSGKISFFCNCFLILFFLTCIMYKKSLEKEKPKLSCNNWWNLSKFSPKFFKSSICARKESQGGSVFKTFKTGSFSLLGQKGSFLFLFSNFKGHISHFIV